MAGVSTTTASSVLNGHGAKLRISQKTRDRVVETATNLGYQANPFACRLRSKKSHSIGLLWSFSGPHASNQLVRYFSGQAMRSGYSTLIYDSLSDLPLMIAQLRELAKNRVDGLIIACKGESAAGPLFPLLRKLPNVLVVTQEPHDLPFLQIAHSMRGAMKEAVSHLLAGGRKRFAFVGNLECNAPKIKNIRESLAAAGVKRPLALLDFPDPLSLSPEDWKRFVLEHREVRSADAILAATDEVAAAVISVLLQAGARVPEDVAVIGFNNNPIAALFNPPIASIKRYDRPIAARAIERIITAIEGTETPSPLAEIVEMTFVWRESAGCPRPS